MEKLTEQLNEEKQKILSLEEALANQSHWISPEQLTVTSTEFAKQASLIDKLNEQLEAEKNRTTDLTNKFRELELSEIPNSSTTEQQEYASLSPDLNSPLTCL
jgi:arginine deiminase